MDKKERTASFVMLCIAFVAVAVMITVFVTGRGTDECSVTALSENADVHKNDGDSDEDELYSGIFDWYDHAVAPSTESFGAFENGDTFYTPAGSQLAFDDDRAVLYYNNLLVVYTYEDVSNDIMSELAESVDGELVGVVRGAIHSFQIKVSERTLSELEDITKILSSDERVMYSSVEYPVQIMGCGNENPWGGEEGDVLGDESCPGGYDWWAEAVGAYTAWEYSEYCNEMNIGIVDTGVDSEHEDLRGQIVLLGENTVDSMDHGTHVAGIMSAIDNSVGIRGIADKLNLYSADLWTGSDSDDSFHTIGELMAIYNNMAQHNVRVINNSWGLYLFAEEYYEEMSEGNDLSYDRWIKLRTEKEIVPTAELTVVMMSQLINSGYDNLIFVQAAGNGYYGSYEWERNADAATGGFFCSVTEDVYNNLDSDILDYYNSTGISYDKIDERILVVTAVDYTDTDVGVEYIISDFANYGDTVDICAPGVGIYSTVNMGDERYTFFDGTSMAAPVVTASVGFVWSLKPELTVSEVREIILSSSPMSVECTFGGVSYSYPMVNVGAAVQSVMSE